MTRFIVPLAGFGLILLGTGAASAASPAYCALYAKEYANKASLEGQGSVAPDRLHDRAYFKCLNMDDEPPLPTAYAPETGGVGGPFVEQGSAATVEETGAVVEGATLDDSNVDPTAVNEAIVRQTAALEVDPPAPKRTGKRRGSGLAQGSPEWKAWCAKHFPKSFDPKTGTIIPLKTGKRTTCR